MDTLDSQGLQKLIYLHFSVISVHKALCWALYHVWFQNKSELYTLDSFYLDLEGHVDQ